MYCEQEETLAEGGITSDVSKRICMYVPTEINLH